VAGFSAKLRPHLGGLARRISPTMISPVGAQEGAQRLCEGQSISG